MDAQTGVPITTPTTLFSAVGIHRVPAASHVRQSDSPSPRSVQCRTAIVGAGNGTCALGATLSDTVLNRPEGVGSAPKTASDDPSAEIELQTGCRTTLPYYYVIGNFWADGWTIEALLRGSQSDGRVPCVSAVAEEVSE